MTKGNPDLYLNPRYQSGLIGEIERQAWVRKYAIRSSLNPDVADIPELADKLFDGLKDMNI